MARQHLWDQAAGAVYDWIDKESTAAVNVIIGNDPPPFSGPASQKELLAYYKRQFFHPDGSDNPEGRSQVMDRVGVKSYVEIWGAIQDSTEVDDGS